MRCRETWPAVRHCRPAAAMATAQAAAAAAALGLFQTACGVSGGYAAAVATRAGGCRLPVTAWSLPAASYLARTCPPPSYPILSLCPHILPACFLHPCHSPVHTCLQCPSAVPACAYTPVPARCRASEDCFVLLYSCSYCCCCCCQYQYRMIHTCRPPFRLCSGALPCI